MRNQGIVIIPIWQENGCDPVIDRGRILAGAWGSLFGRVGDFQIPIMTLLKV